MFPLLNMVTSPSPANRKRDKRDKKKRHEKTRRRRETVRKKIRKRSGYEKRKKRAQNGAERSKTNPETENERESSLVEETEPQSIDEQPTNQRDIALKTSKPPTKRNRSKTSRSTPNQPRSSNVARNLTEMSCSVI
ncbi:hypothetical protein BDN72DRAFT_615674 [Pluteus cervinus]|uniref:Uncharacterized protein n=1 Tax=Pluteus cervinus TaxID=181527 RepID=A0ACD3A105_9AGAR|nr:hypothetical protein BDN72DRAFT_615674 [Pluteus cervinus]